MRSRWMRIVNGMGLGLILRQLNAMYGPWANERLLGTLCAIAVVVSIVLGLMAICSGLHHLWMLKGGQRARLWHRAHRAFRSLHGNRRWRGFVHQCRPISRSRAAAFRLVIPEARERQG